MRFLPLLALLPLPVAAAGDLGWDVQVSATSKFAPVEFRAQLVNVTNANVAFRAEGERPAVELILEADGKAAVRKPLPKQAVVSKGPSRLAPRQFGWYVSGDVRHAFGRLQPGRYTLRATLGGVVSAPTAFEVVDTSLEDAKKAWNAPEGIEFRVKEEGVGILANHRKQPIQLWSYGDLEPLQALVMVQQWTGRGWTASPGGYCGTGLVEVTIAPGAEKRVALPPIPDGIVRVAVSCSQGNGDKTVPIEAVTEPFLVDTFKG